MSPRHTQMEVMEAAGKGMIVAIHARENGDRPAIIADGGTLTFDQLNARVNQLVRALRARGVKPGDAIAVACSNRAEFAECTLAAQRGGLRFTPINFHLTGPEISYIAVDCEARALLGDARFAENLAHGEGLVFNETSKSANGSGRRCTSFVNENIVRTSCQ